MKKAKRTISPTPPCAACGKPVKRKGKRFCSLRCYWDTPEFRAVCRRNGLKRRGTTHDAGPIIAASKLGRKRLDIRGRRHPNYRHGRTRRSERVEYIEWRQKVLARDKKCVDCGKKATDVHHRILWQKNKNNYDPRIGVALCRGCHIRRHRLHEYQGLAL